MPRKFGGRTPLGSSLNEMGSKQEGVWTTQVRYRMGTIVAFASEFFKDGQQKITRATEPNKDGIYSFIVRIDNGNETGFLPLVGKADEHALTKGHPSQLIGKKCIFSFEGPSSNRGKILNVIDDFVDGTLVGAHNQLQITGAAFAPPGAGI